MPATQPGQVALKISAYQGHFSQTQITEFQLGRWLNTHMHSTIGLFKRQRYALQQVPIGS